jgi:phosphopantothenoylcysteine decarboxylase / phosphopantothenate---cysteine ligase
MGYAIAESLAHGGAHVELISGPVSISLNHPNVKTTHVQTAAEMAEICFLKAKTSDVVIMSAAVADFTPEATAVKKIKKGDRLQAIRLKPTVDILHELGKVKTKWQVLVGFALESDNEIPNALGKLKNKNLDLIVLNSLQDQGAGFNHDTNKVTFIHRNEKMTQSNLKSKKEIADELVNIIDELLKSKKNNHE